IGGGVVLDPFPPARPPRLRHRILSSAQAPAERLREWTREAGLAGLAVSDLPVRLGILPGEIGSTCDLAGKDVLNAGGWLVYRGALTGELKQLGASLDAYHRDHLLDPGMSLQALRASVTGDPPGAVLDLLLDLGIRKKALEVDGGVVRRPGWQAAVAARADGAGEALFRRLVEAKWQVPTIDELERESAGTPVRALLAHLARGGGVEQLDQDRYAATTALADFRSALEAAIAELGPVTPAQLRDRFGLTRKYLIPLLEWADRRGITKRTGDARVLARLTGARGGA
ncbi:MAG TPA: SelB C-terminal domain-containing protein, partial [Gemmatimonadales bacterium]